MESRFLSWSRRRLIIRGLIESILWLININLDFCLTQGFGFEKCLLTPPSTPTLWLLSESWGWSCPKDWHSYFSKADIEWSGAWWRLKEEDPSFWNESSAWWGQTKQSPECRNPPPLWASSIKRGYTRGDSYGRGVGDFVKILSLDLELCYGKKLITR